MAVRKEDLDLSKLKTAITFDDVLLVPKVFTFDFPFFIIRLFAPKLTDSFAYIVFIDYLIGQIWKCVNPFFHQLSSVKSRRDVSVSTKLSRNITLNIPIVSSNMDTVTGKP